MVAEFEGHCDYCDEPIEPGNEIESLEDWGWVHRECGEEIDDDNTARASRDMHEL